jgi:hypothetical protein
MYIKANNIPNFFNFDYAEYSEDHHYYLYVPNPSGVTWYALSWQDSSGFLILPSGTLVFMGFLSVRTTSPSTKPPRVIALPMHMALVLWDRQCVFAKMDGEAQHVSIQSFLCKSTDFRQYDFFSFQSVS